MSIATYLNSLDNDRDTLAANLTTMGVQASSSETFTSLVPKVLTIPTGGGMEMKDSVTLSGINSNNVSTIASTNSWFAIFDKLTFENKEFIWSSSVTDFYAGFLTVRQSLVELIFKNCSFANGSIFFNSAYFTTLEKLRFENCSGGEVRVGNVVKEITLINTNAGANNSNTNLRKYEYIRDVATTPTSITNFFSNDTALEYLDISGYDCTGITSSSNYSGAFNNVPTTCTILVRDAANQAWFSAKFPSYTFTVKS